MGCEVLSQEVQTLVEAQRRQVEQLEDHVASLVSEVGRARTAKGGGLIDRLVAGNSAHSRLDRGHFLQVHPTYHFQRF